MPAPTVHAARLAAQGLTGPPLRDAVGVAERLLAVQAQDLRGARLAVRARTAHTCSSDVDAALAEGALVVDWLQRGTLHLVRAEDHAWLHALTAPTTVASNARRLGQEGVSPEQARRGVEVVRRAVADGPQTRDALRARLGEAGVPVAGQAAVHVLLAASLQGHVVRGPVVEGAQAFVEARSWLGARPALDRDAALGELALRYLRGHGPATDRDLARWSGLPLGQVRRGLGRLRLVELDDGLVDLPGREQPGPLPPPRLLGPFEPLLLGWTSREDVVGPHRGLVTSNGVFRAFALVAGRAVATWGADGVVPLEPLAPEVLAALEADATDVARYLSC